MTESITDLVLEREYVGDARRILTTYDFRLGTLTQRITIRLYWNIPRQRVEFEQSHFFHSQAQHGPYSPDSAYGHSEEEALRKALEPFTAFYQYAIREGHDPEETWLEPNERFH